MSIATFATGQILWFYDGTYPYFAWNNTDTSLMVGDLDLDGDGRSDFLAITSDSRESDVYAFRSTGQLLYRLPAHQYGLVALNVTAMPDMDGDGCNEFLVGCIDPTARGIVIVVSGRTGQIARLSYGLHVGDVIGGTVCNAGDVDQDGMDDYAAASYWSSPLTSIVIFSGRTGAVIHSWDDYWTTPSAAMIGNIDVDLDGIPDLIVGNAGYPVSPFYSGQIRAYSGRDATVLWNHNALNYADQWQIYQMTNLGVQPGNPYPVFAFRDQRYLDYGPPVSSGRVIAVRTNLPGAGPVTGTACSSTGQLPQIGMRKFQNRTRITVAKGIPGALAWLVGAPAAQTTYGAAALPYALDPFGLFGCTAFVPPVVVAPTVVGTSGIDRGYAAIDLPWPSLSPTGAALAAQWLLLDPTTGDYAVTARHEFRVP